MMKYLDGRRSICVSSQSGCPLTCTFCATGTMAFGRNLTTAEILDQALFFKRIEDNVNHLVFMGMGEPMMNLDNVLAACEKLPDIGITSRRTTVSTVGWLPGIKQFNKIERPVRLALSLHAADPELRSKIMPVNDRWPLEDVLAECRKHYEENNRRVYIEYVMLDGVNDHTEPRQAARRGAPAPQRLQGQSDPVQPDRHRLRRIGPHHDRAPSRTRCSREGVVATVRLTRGQDIAAACGQLVADAIQKAAVSDTDAALA